MPPARARGPPCPVIVAGKDVRDKEGIKVVVVQR